MASVEEDIIAEDTAIIWVLEADSSTTPGTSTSCRNFVNQQGSDQGLCVGDGETRPEQGEFDDSPFSVFRGFDIVVDRASMEILYSTSHGTPGGNENPSGPDILETIRQIRATN